jgi:hypothetical protein
MTGVIVGEGVGVVKNVGVSSKLQLRGGCCEGVLQAGRV